MSDYVLNCGDCVKYLQGLEAESVDLVVVDPGYQSLEKWRAIGTTTRLKKRWFPIFPDSLFPEFLQEIHRALKKNTHFYLFCDWTTLRLVAPLGEAAGFKLWKPLIWDKMDMGTGYHYRTQHEFILFFEKGKRALNSKSIPDVLRHKKIYNKYPTQKPVSLLEVLIRQSSRKGQMVVDPQMGSGSTGVAALRLGRKFMGCDISREAVDLAKENLADAGTLLAGIE